MPFAIALFFIFIFFLLLLSLNVIMMMMIMTNLLHVIACVGFLYHCHCLLLSLYICVISLKCNGKKSWTRRLAVFYFCCGDVWSCDRLGFRPLSGASGCRVITGEQLSSSRQKPDVLTRLVTQTTRLGSVTRSHSTSSFRDLSSV